MQMETSFEGNHALETDTKSLQKSGFQASDYLTAQSTDYSSSSTESTLPPLEIDYDIDKKTERVEPEAESEGAIPNDVEKAMADMILDQKLAPGTDSREVFEMLAEAAYHLGGEDALIELGTGINEQIEKDGYKLRLKPGVREDGPADETTVYAFFLENEDQRVVAPPVIYEVPKDNQIDA